MADIFGTIGGETLTGTIGNDMIDHRGGSDVINGGGGVDTLLFFDHSSHYQITTLLGVTRVFGFGRASLEYAGAEVLLVNVEKIQFQNTLVSLEATPPGVLLGTTASEQIVGTLGNDIIDHQGGADWIDGGLGTDTVLFFDDSSHFGITNMSGVLRVFGYGRADAPYLSQEVILNNVESIQFLDRRMTYGGSGDDVLSTWSGKDTVDGGGGTDTVVINAARSASSVELGASAITVTGPAGTDTLQNVERLQFADRSVAFDLLAGQAAGNTVLMAAAAAGRAFVADPVLLGGGLRFAEQYDSMQQLADAVVDLGIYDQFSNRQFIQFVANNVQYAASEAEIALYAQFLDFGIDRSQILRVFAESDFNVQSVNLVGLQQTGIEFV